MNQADVLTWALNHGAISLPVAILVLAGIYFLPPLVGGLLGARGRKTSSQAESSGGKIQQTTVQDVRAERDVNVGPEQK
jgi:uncharacterized membrane protein